MSYTDSAPSSRQTGERRRLFLEAGEQFASSYKRAQSYLGLSLLLANEFDDVSPNTSPRLEAVDSPTIDVHLAGELQPNHGYDHISSFTFPHNEDSRLLEDEASVKTQISAYGSSTVPHTIFNSVNTLMGVGMLSLPFAFKLSGWIVSSVLLVVIAFTTSFTAKILGRILKKHPNLKSYGDIAHLYGGSSIEAIVTLFFSLDLMGAMISMIILFSNSFNIFFPSLSVIVFKCLIVSIVFVLSFLPLSVLSLFSLLGIVCTSSILIIVIVCGLLTTAGPGSLLSPVTTRLFPTEYKNVFLSFGIFLSPWGGHPVFPEFYRDMVHPSRFEICCNVTFFTAFDLDFFLSFAGYLMFGDDCQDSITSNLMTNKGYPKLISPLICVFMGLLPISKLPLIAKPLITVYESYFGLSESLVEYGKRKEIFGFKRIVSRIIFCTFIFIISVIFTSFGQVVSLLGSAICFTICLTLPLLFYSSIFEDELTSYQKFFFRTGAAISFICSLIGTYGSIFIDPV